MTDDYDGLGFYTCVIKKNVSVLKRIKDVLFAPAIVSAVGIAVLILIAAVMQYTYPMVTGVLAWFVVFGMANLATSIILLVVSLFEVYCVVWCIRNRRQKQQEKLNAETSVCPIENTKKGG